MTKPTNNPPQNPPQAAPAVTATAPVPGSAVELKQPLRWKAANDAELKMLGNLQGNILKGHGRDHTWNIFFKFGGDQAASRRLLRELGNHHVTSAHVQLLEAERFKTDKVPGGSFMALVISDAGYKAIGHQLNVPDENTVFGPGMKQGAADLGDHLSTWEEPFKHDIHAMILIADDDVPRGTSLTAAVEGKVTDAGGLLLHTQRGKAVRNTIGNGLEHFGYVDGRSQPLLLWEDIEKEARDEGISQWDPAFPLDVALVPDPLALMHDPLQPGQTVRDDSSFGSFFIFRKLEQNVQGFKTREQDLADTLGLTGDERELAGALVVGRFEDGTPVTMSDEAIGLKNPRNDFDYRGDAAASRCPFHAHIRKTNPRGSGGFEPHADERLHIMPRRGITYEDSPREVHPDCLPETESTPEFMSKVHPNLPTGGLGLLFMAYNSRLDQQFAFTQRSWANFPGFPRAPAPPGLDAVIGQDDTNPGGQVYPKGWDDPAKGSEPFDFKGFVTTKGGEYFFAPSLTFLRNL